MPLDLSEIKSKLQDHLQDGLLMVVGTGLSVAEGIPGMADLALHLKKVIPGKLNPPDPAWDQVVTALDNGKDLEHAMVDVTLSPFTVDLIVEETSKHIGDAESKVFTQVLGGSRVLPFTTFVKHLFKAAKKFHLITPNYDRLIEFATEAAGIGVDSRFFGYLHASVDPKRSADAHRESYTVGKTHAFRSLQCLSVYKPHGSLDWYEINGKLVRTPINIGKAPLIITPGISKYRESFRWAFDDQRVAGNKSAEKAVRLLFIGYGFNDDHLEQYVCPGLHFMKPTVIITKELTANARRLVSNSHGVDVLTLTANSPTDYRTRISNSLGEELLVNEELWNLEGFNKGVI